MFQIIKDIFATNRSEQVAFKWWTLAYFIYGLDRFSTDIDLDFLHWLPTQDQTQDIQAILKKHWSIKDFQQFRNMHRYIFSYGDGDHNIKIECNTRIREANQYETVNFFGSPLQAMDKSSIFANKLVAVMDRKNPTSRDLRDVHFFFVNHFPINEWVIHERTGMNLQVFFQELKKYISKNFKSSEIVDANLWVVLDQEQKQRAKKNLLEKIGSFIDLQIFEGK